MNLSDRLARLSPEKRALLERRLRAAQEQQTAEAAARIPAGDPELLSFSERRLWFVDQLEPDHPFYNLPLAAELSGPLNHDAFWRALDLLVQRHESLRSTYHWREGDVVRRIHASVQVVREHHDLSAREADASDLAVRRRLHRDSQRTFDLQHPPLLRCTLYRLAEQRHVALLVMHHIICDGWSMAVMLRELAVLYEAASRAAEADDALVAAALPPVRFQYRDFAAWQHAPEQRRRIEEGIEIWRRRLQDAPRLLHLPLDFPRPAVQDFRGSLREFQLSGETSQRLRELARGEHATEFMVLLAAYAALLERLTDQRDFCIGTVTANRQLPEWESLIGFFVNTLVMRLGVQPDDSFRRLVQRARQTAIEANQHDDAPLERLVEELVADRDRSHSPLFQTALIVQNTPREFPVAQGLQMRILEVDNSTAKYDLTWFFWEADGVWRGRVEYRSGLFLPETIDGWVASFQTLLGEALAEPDRDLRRCEWLTAAQQQQVLRWGENPQRFPPHQALTTLVLQWAQTRGEAEAVAAPAAQWTYDQLRGTVERIAAALRRRLRDLPPPAESPAQPRIVVNLPRGPEQVACLLAVMHAGCVYVPTDPDQPGDRLDYVVLDSQASLVIGDYDGATPAVDFASLANDADAPPVAPPPDDPHQLAYLIYTSGTTGRPKGVAIEHGGIVNFIRGQIQRLEVQPDDRVLHSLSPVFDGGLSEVLLALVSGACLVVAPRDAVLDPERFSELIRENGVTVGKFPPTLLATLDPRQTPGMKTVSTGGESLTGDLAERWLQGGRKMFNGYGPTEVSVGASMHRLTSPAPPQPPIGVPLANARIYVLDEARRLVPPGVTGEIFLGGPGVARGYWRQPELTAEKFSPDPFAGEPAARMYRTGDLGRWNRQGLLEFQGRRDQQVKLRGYRIEPQEIAARMLEAPRVDQAVVVLREDPPGGPRLVGYWTEARDPEADRTADRRQVEGWLELFQTTHRSAPPALDPELNIAGWVSSFDGRPLPAAEMRAWAEETAAKIRRLRPRRLWEIGCGTGLILFRVMDHCEQYFGVDFLQSSLDQLQRYLEHRPELAHKITLQRREAVQLDPPPPWPVDTVVLNSVIQYFPGADYLWEVLRGVLTRTAPGGRVFIGDVRSLDLHAALAAAIESSRAAPDTPAATLVQRIQQRLRREEELLASPALFRDLPRWFPRIREVEITWKTAAADNELTRYRYDVVLHLDQAANPAAASPPETPPPTVGEREAWSELLARRPEGLVSGAVHRAVRLDLALWDALRQAGKEPLGSVMQRVRQDLPASAIMPRDVAQAAGDLGRELVCELDPASPDACRLRWGPANVSEPRRHSGPLADGPGPALETPPPEWRQWTNQPSGDAREQEIVAEIRDRLRRSLPDYMTPSALVRVDQLPRTLQGKVDVRALPPPPAIRGEGADFVAPATDSQRLIASVWENLLDVRPIGLHDDFFSLGGHSMLAVRVMAEIEQRSGRRLPLASLFQHPTVEHLAKLLDQPDEQPVSCLAPLRTAGGEAPLYLVHPAGGAVFCYLELASHFVRRPVIGVQAVGIDGLQPPHEDVAEMAEHYLEAILEQQPQGPYHLAGWSLGGNLAYEIACRLAERGAEVGLVGLLDAAATPPAESLREEDFLDLLVALFPGQQALALEELRRMEPAEQLKYFLDRATAAGLAPPQDEEAGRRVFHVFQTNVKALHQHRLRRYGGEVVLFRASVQEVGHALAKDPALGWGQWAAGGVTVVAAPGSHAQMVHPPHARGLAELLEQEIARRERRPSP